MNSDDKFCCFTKEMITTEQLLSTLRRMNRCAGCANKPLMTSRQRQGSKHGCLAFRKAFDTVSHRIFVSKMSSIQLNMMGEQLAERSGSKTYSKCGNISVVASY